MRRSLSATCLLLIAMAAVSYAILSRPEPPNNLAIESIGTPGTSLPGEVTLSAPIQTDGVALASFIGTAEAAPALPSAIEITGDTTPSFPAAPTGLTVGITGDIGDPVVALTSPEAGFVGGSVAWTATCTDDDTVESVQLVANNTPVCDPDTVSTYGGTCDLETELTLTEDTALTLKARCCDTAANCADSTGVAVTVDITDPQIVLDSPQTGYHATSVAWSVDTQDGDGSGIASVQLKLGGVNEGAAITTPPFSGSVDISGETDATELVFSATVCDNVGLCDDSNTATVTVDNTPPTSVSITSHVDTDIVTGIELIEATATDTVSGIASVTCYRDTTIVISIATSSPYECEWNTDGLASGNYNLHVVAENGAGETTASTPISVVIEGTAPTLPSGLLAHYRFEGDGTDETTTYNATAVGTPTYGTGQVGQAVSLAGTGNHFTVATNIPLANSSFTIAAWVNRANSDAFDPVFTQGAGTTAQGLQVGYRSVDDLYFSFWGAGYEMDTVATYTDFGTWHHVIWTYDATTNLMTIYRDDTSVGTFTTTDDYVGTGTTTIGARLFGAAQRFVGSIDELMIFNKVLDATERTQVFEYDGTGGGGDPEPGTLVAHWKFDETGNTSTAADSSGNGHSGTLTNFPADPTANWVTGQYDGALDFDGTNDTVTAGDIAALDGATALTIMGWVNHALRDYSTVIEKGTGTTKIAMQTGATGDGGGNNDAYLVLQDGGTTYAWTNANVLTNNGWQHWAMVYDGSLTSNANVLKFYLDGVQQSLTFSGIIPATGPSTASVVRMGGSASDAFLDGQLDDVRVYSEALTQAQIEDIFVEGGGVPGGGEPPPSGTVYYVSKTGTASNCAGAQGGGTAARATIAAGLGCLASGDTLIVQAGTYNESVVLNVPSGTVDDYTTVMGEAGAVVTICPTVLNETPVSRIMKMGAGGTSYVHVKNFVLDSSCYTNSPTVSTSGLFTAPTSGNSTHHLLFEDIEIKHTRGDASHMRATYGTIFRRMNIHSLTPSRADTSGATGIYFQGNVQGTAGNIVEDSIIDGKSIAVDGNGISMIAANDPIVRNNVIMNIAEQACIIIRDSSTDGPTRNLLFYNNICINNFAGILFATSNDNNNRIYNNTVFDTNSSSWGHCLRRSGLNALTTAQAVRVKNNICWGLANTGLQVTGNFYSNPNFIDSTGTNFADFNLKLSSSPGVGARDTGQSFSGVFTTSFEAGVSRPQGSGWDYGAYEQ